MVREAASSLAMLNLHPQKFVSVHIRTGFMNSYTKETSLQWDIVKGDRFARNDRQIADSMFGNDRMVFV